MITENFIGDPSSVVSLRNAACDQVSLASQGCSSSEHHVLINWLQHPRKLKSPAAQSELDLNIDLEVGGYWHTNVREQNAAQIFDFPSFRYRTAQAQHTTHVCGDYYVYVVSSLTSF